MTAATHKVLQSALALTDEERAELAALLIESLEATVEMDADVAEEWRAELARRIAAIEDGTVKTIPWEDVRRRLFKDPDAGES
jgi:putative addiction module component (TIGR02574 family)